MLALIALTISYNKVNKYGFSLRDFDVVKKNRNFSKRQEVQFLNRHISLTSTFGFLAFFAAYAIFTVSGIVAIKSSFDLIAMTKEGGEAITINATSTVFYYSGAKIGSSMFATTLSG